MTTIAAGISSSYAIPVRSAEPAKIKQTPDSVRAFLELTEAAHRAVPVAENSAATFTPATLASPSAGLAATLWNLDSGAEKSTLPTTKMASAAEPAAQNSVESEVLKALAKALGVDDAA